MLSQLVTLTVGGLLACTPLQCDEPQEPQGKPPCETLEIILPSSDHETTCDVSPPQILSYFEDDPGPVQDILCQDHGGRLQTDDLLQRTVCYDIDY